MFEYVFMQRALLVGLVLGAVLSCIGLLIVMRRQSMIGDALSHSSLAGVALGLILGLNPLVGAVIICVVAALSIDFFGRRIGRYREMAIAIVMSTGIGLASVLSDFVRSASNFQSYLFGSIVAISAEDAWLTVILSILVLVIFFAKLEALFFSSYSERSARLAGINVPLTDFIFTLMTAIMVSLASRTVGALIVSSFMVIPAACAMQLAKSFRQTLLFSFLFSELFIFAGLTASFYLKLKPGGTFVLIALLVFLLILLFKSAAKSLKRAGQKGVSHGR